MIEAAREGDDKRKREGKGRRKGDDEGRRCWRDEQTEMTLGRGVREGRGG